jgi:hypothetical protein
MDVFLIARMAGSRTCLAVAAKASASPYLPFTVTPRISAGRYDDKLYQRQKCLPVADGLDVITVSRS